MVLYRLLQLLQWLIIIRALMSWFVDPRSTNPVVVLIRNATEAILRPIRSVLPDMGGMDLSPLVAIFAIYLLQELVVRAAMM
ncbi:MAG: YggT family protein [Gemmatimonadetes bacterium]|nr:YggT family protein [Gemmatimonadota bacterium]